jgi:ATP-dependent RNA helicase DDX27
MGDSIWQQFTIDSDDDELPDEDIDDDAEEMGGLDEWDEQPVRRGVEKEDDEEDSEDEEDSGDEDNLKTMPHAEERAHRAGEKVQRQIAQEEEEAAEAEAKYFDEVMDFDEPKEAVFAQLNLSRPLLRAVEAAGYTSPTPVQIAVIPLALEGRDVCASAATGSGKTGAFVLPFLERLLYRPKDVAAIRVLVVTPTRELATQVFTVLQKMSMFTDITSALICGGKKDLKSQVRICIFTSLVTTNPLVSSRKLFFALALTWWSQPQAGCWTTCATRSPCLWTSWTCWCWTRSTAC